MGHMNQGCSTFRRLVQPFVLRNKHIPLGTYESRRQ